MAKTTKEKSATAPEQTQTIPTQSFREKRLFRSTTDRMVAGVCGGLGNYFNIDPVLIRILFAILIVSGGAGGVLYVILYLVVPEENSVNKTQNEIFKENSSQLGDTVKEVAGNVESLAKEQNSSVWVGIIIVVVGVLLLGQSFGLLNVGDFFRFVFRTLWPVLVIGIGVLILVKGKGN